MRNGFTLVELSIVLVIVGLLVGGILVGQSLITSAENLRFIRQIQQYDVAISAFQSKFRQLPGDTKLLTPIGNGDGVIQQISDDNTFQGESMNFWMHMSQGGMLPNDPTYTSVGVGIVAGTNLPKAIIRAKGNVGIMVGTCTDGCLYPNVNSYWISHFPTGVRNTWGGSCPWSFPSLDTDPCGPSMSPITAAAIDSKIDDGKPLSGAVWAGAWNEWDTLPAAAESSALGCHNGTRYWVETKAYKCALQIRLGFAAGKL